MRILKYGTFVIMETGKIISAKRAIEMWLIWYILLNLSTICFDYRYYSVLVQQEPYFIRNLLSILIQFIFPCSNFFKCYLIFQSPFNTS